MTMKFKVSRADMWSATIEDQPGGAARVLDPVAKAGANFEFAFARQAPELPGKGLLFVLPVKGAKVLQAAQAAGLAKAEGITKRISDKAGVTYETVATLKGVQHLDKFDDAHAILLVKTEAGALNLQTIALP